MSQVQLINCEYKENSCDLRITVPNCGTDSVNCTSTKKCIQNLRNFDVYMEEYNFLIYLDVKLYKFRSTRCFKVWDVRELLLYYNSKEELLSVTIPCLPCKKNINENRGDNAISDERSVDLWELKRLTDCCWIRVDSGPAMKAVADFGYGFASKFHGEIKNNFGCDLDAVTRLSNPDQFSPLQRSVDRNIDETKEFCPDQYKVNFVELQVPEGHQNPINLIIDYKDIKFTPEEEHLLHNLTCKQSGKIPPDQDQMEIDCGLISILMAICYDVRSTNNEPTCESAWTRSVLSPTYSYFEPFNNLRDVVIGFYRRSLTYPYYRNYDFSRQCMEDCVTALQSHPQWILKQLMITHEMFENTERAVFNHYFLNDYINYVANANICPLTHLQMLALNLKNVLFDIYKKHLGLGLMELEKNLLKELITDIQIETSNSGDESEESVEDDLDNEDDQNGSESCESELRNSNDSSDTEENSVIEKQMHDLKILLCKVT